MTSNSIQQFDNTLSVDERAENALNLAMAGEAERASFATIIRAAIQGRDDSFILALRTAREKRCGDSREADVWIRATLAGAVRGKEFKALPRLTVKCDKVMPGVVNRYVAEKERTEKADTEKQNEALEKAIAVVRAALMLHESGEIEVSKANLLGLSALKGEFLKFGEEDALEEAA